MYTHQLCRVNEETCLTTKTQRRTQKVQIFFRSELLLSICSVAFVFFFVFSWSKPVLVFSQQARENERERRILEIQRLFGEGDLAGARKLLDEASKRFPADAGLDNLQGVIDAQEGNYGAAERSFRRALTRDRKFTGAYLNLGRLYQEHSADDPQALTKAIDVYRRLLQYEPANAEANYQSAALLMRKGSYQSSLDHLSRLPAKIQENAQVLSVSCADYAGLGRIEPANELARRLIAHPEYSEPDVSAILPALTGGGRDDLSVELLEGLRKWGPLSPEM